MAESLIQGILGNASEIPVDEVKRELSPLLLPGETIESAFKTIRDKTVFTGLRMIIIDRQGLSGEKIAYITIPYGSVDRFAMETAGGLDFDSQLAIWTTGIVDPVTIGFRKDTTTLIRVHNALAGHVLTPPKA